MLRILLLLSLILIPTAAKADGGLILPPRIHLSLVHHHYMNPEQFGIMMRVPDMVTGCFDVSGLEYQTSFIDGNFKPIR